MYMYILAPDRVFFTGSCLTNTLHTKIAKLGCNNLLNKCSAENKPNKQNTPLRQILEYCQ